MIYWAKPSAELFSWVGENDVVNISMERYHPIGHLVEVTILEEKLAVDFKLRFHDQEVDDIIDMHKKTINAYNTFIALLASVQK